MINFQSADLIPSRRVVTDMTLGTEGPGVYGIFFDSGQLLLEKSGYLEFDRDFPLSVDGYDLMYVGATLKLMRSRLLCHLKGNSKTSSLRMTVGTVLADDLALDPVGDGRHAYFDFGTGEARLSAWMVENTKVVFLPDNNPFATEREMILDIPLPFNIGERRAHPFSKYLLNLHSYYAGRPRVGCDTSGLIRASSHRRPTTPTVVRFADHGS